ncbi:MAG: nicotinamide riboside transporter PnuC [Methanosarcina sp.]
MNIYDWVKGNYIELFGAITGVIYVFLEIRQNIWLWPVGIVTSAVYIWVFFSSKFYADMSLQAYYLIISILGWYWWLGGIFLRKGEGEKGSGKILKISHIRMKTMATLTCVFFVLYAILWAVLSKLTDSPVPAWDSFITSLSVIATWMLARKIYEHWYLWIVVNTVSAVIFVVKGLYPTVILYSVYGIMSFAGLIEWRKVFRKEAEIKG